ncbi:hypothetical protein M9H77_11695 [Catharanthus roseus]|uniref:Uncharacterized protein n=1 Tax=Catharanthus roseus TaxID=4058 RepID=A0ACC0BFC1_CATRO|nr:hypothetical protein M9H77_11695 [Catharanthus roseus]
MRMELKLIKICSLMTQELRIRCEVENHEGLGQSQPKLNSWSHQWLKTLQRYTSLVDPKIVGFELDCALLDILHDECLRKFIENIDYVFPFLDAFMKNLDGVIHSNQRFHILSGQVELSCNI